jgi:hypothetical protein
MNKTRMRAICCKLDVEGHDATLAAPLAVTQRAAIASAASARSPLPGRPPPVQSHAVRVRAMRAV